MVIIDVRSKQEFDEGHVDGALWFDIDRLVRGELPDVPKDEELVLYCRSGARSTAAAHLLQQHGFAYAHSAGGLSQMAMKGHQIVR